MSVIKPRTRGKHLVQHWTRLDSESRETLHAYAAFIGEDAQYVVNQLIETVLAKDKDFVKWRAQHPESHVPPPKWKKKARRSRGQNPALGMVSGREAISAARAGDSA